MARPLRIEYHGAWYHFTSRGDERNLIFKDDTDREKFLAILKGSLEKYLVQLHGYVLMENRFHRTEQSKSRELVKEITQEFLIETVCKVFEIDRAGLLKRRSLYRKARMVYINLCCKYRLYHKSLREIGVELGGLTVSGMSQVRGKKETERENAERWFPKVTV